jgi:hypothetical protein
VGFGSRCIFLEIFGSFQKSKQKEHQRPEEEELHGGRIWRGGGGAWRTCRTWARPLLPNGETQCGDDLLVVLGLLPAPLSLDAPAPRAPCTSTRLHGSRHGVSAARLVRARHLELVADEGLLLAAPSFPSLYVPAPFLLLLQRSFCCGAGMKRREARGRWAAVQRGGCDNPPRKYRTIA